jgi:Tfp pilus assembly protein PilN
VANVKAKEINLLKDRFSQSITGRLLNWLLKTFRIVVMVTEMIVMGAFISRFWLDARNSDLIDEIDQKRMLLEAQSKFENDFRDIQNRLSIIQKLSSSEKLKSQYIERITQNLTNDIVVTSVSFTAKEILVKGTSPSEKSISQFIVNLRAENTFANTQLTQLRAEGGEAGLLEFGIITRI